MKVTELEGNLVDVRRGDILPARISLIEDRIVSITPLSGQKDVYLLPGLIDAHIHIESSLLCPARFSEAAISRGTTAVVSDPHEIANVMGLEGVKYMFQEAERTPLRIYYTAPSCVPALGLEGPKLDAEDVRQILSWERCVGLGEVMDVRAVLQDEPSLIAKLDAAKDMGKRIDGHAPGLRGAPLLAYVAAGPDSDHECTSAQEAEEKHRLGMRIMVREGSAAKDLANLIPFAQRHDCMLVSDDLDAADLLLGHVDRLLRRAVEEGMDPVRAIRAVTLMPAEHYRLPLGELAEGSLADITVVRDLKSFEPLQTWIGGRLVAQNGTCLVRSEARRLPHSIFARKVSAEALILPGLEEGKEMLVQEALPGQIVGGWKRMRMLMKEGEVIADLERDILLLAVLDRRRQRPPTLSLITGFGLRYGAIAASVAHDAHNIIGVGVDRQSLAKALNAVIDMGGGLYAWNGREERSLPLPLAGLMTDRPCAEVASLDEELRSFVQAMGCKLPSPFMTLSFQDPEFRRAIMSPIWSKG
ncbi:MAG: adenine deaminase [Methanomassiliicoccales archaeon]